MMKHKNFLILLLLTFIMVLTFNGYADPPGPPGPGGPPGGGGGVPVGAPIDGNVCVLIILGMCYALIKLYFHQEEITLRMRRLIISLPLFLRKNLRLK
jgi:hypothetical protein